MVLWGISDERTYDGMGFIARPAGGVGELATPVTDWGGGGLSHLGQKGKKLIHSKYLKNMGL